MPVLTFAGWVVFGPRGVVRREDLLPSLIWPVAWLAATLALGPVVSWYPYPFINVDQIGYGAHPGQLRGHRGALPGARGPRPVGRPTAVRRS